MKTEYNLPDELVFEAKAIADRHQTTLDAVVENALRSEIYSTSASARLEKGSSPTPNKPRSRVKSNRGWWIAAAILAVGIATMVINSFFNAGRDSPNVIARQQQAVLQRALGDMTTAYMISGPHPVEKVRRYYMYNDFAKASPTDTRNQLERLALLAEYLDDDTYTHLKEHSTMIGIVSSALIKTDQIIVLSDWEGGKYKYAKAELKSRD